MCAYVQEQWREEPSYGEALESKSPRPECSTERIAKQALILETLELRPSY